MNPMTMNRREACLGIVALAAPGAKAFPKAENASDAGKHNLLSRSVTFSFDQFRSLICRTPGACARSSPAFS
jgi:hypothetical protein